MHGGYAADDEPDDEPDTACAEGQAVHVTQSEKSSQINPVAEPEAIVPDLELWVIETLHEVHALRALLHVMP